MYNLPAMRKLFAILTLAGVFLAVGFSQVSLHTLAAPDHQIPIYTPTPGPDGRILYIVKENDTLLGISLITGVPVDELRRLNNIQGDTIIQGQTLLLGYAGPAPETAAAPGPTATPTPLLPTASPQPGTGTLCVLIFNDVNGDSIRQESEIVIPDGAISISNQPGNVSLTASTEPQAEPAPICFTDIQEGIYTISVAYPEGYNPTTITNYTLELLPGDETYLDFGAQVNSETAAESPLIVEPDSERSPLLGIVGGIFLVAGLLLAIFAGQLLRKR